ncbi:MAG: hypothetical protein J5I47_13295 [Vicingus serpentipes]|nr:hypothetical protein [Vicingus serpentipes]
MKKIIGQSNITSTDDLINIKNYLNSTISHIQELKEKKRPLLRHTATQIIKSKYGFCGENARVAIKLFLLGGVKANRIYLFRKEWEHVLIEHEMNKKWYMFDGHYDENTLLRDSQVVSILSENINEYPDDYPNNPYLDYCRIKLLRKTPGLALLSKVRLPSLCIYILESPYLIKAIGCIVGIIFYLALIILR